MQIQQSSMSFESLHESDDLAYFIRMRRQEMRMTCARAAKLAGLSVSQWKALESGKFPSIQDNISFTIAGTLEVSVDLIRWLAASN